MQRQTTRFLVTAGILVVLAVLTPQAALCDVVVYPGNMDGWAFRVTDNNGDPPASDASAGFVNGPATPPLGTGSVHFQVGTGDQSAGIRNSSYSGTRLADITALSYSTYATAWNGQQLPYLSLAIDRSDLGLGPDDTLFFEPAYQLKGTGNPTLPDQQAVVLNQWQTWDAKIGGWWNNDGDFIPGYPNVGSLASYLALYPNAVMVNRTDGVGAIRLVSGFASPENKFDSNVDAFTIGVNGNNTTYDFELNGPAAVPEPVSVLLFGGVLLCIARPLRRKLQRLR
jgi:hypothetical protein